MMLTKRVSIASVACLLLAGALVAAQAKAPDITGKSSAGSTGTFALSRVK